MVGESLSTLAEMVVENQVEEDALQIRHVNRILTLEMSLGRCDWSVPEVPANVWQAIHDLQQEMSQKASEKDLEDILEFVQEGTGSNPSQGAGVQFQTTVRPNLGTYMDPADSIPSGRDMMDSEPPANQDSNLLSRGASVNSTCLDKEIKVLRKLLNELHDKVYGAGGSGYTFKGRPIGSQLDVEALLEKELPEKYVPLSYFVCPYILLDFVHRYLFNKLTLSVSDQTKCNDCGLEIFDFLAGEAKQKIVPSLLSSTKLIQGVI